MEGALLRRRASHIFYSLARIYGFMEKTVAVKNIYHSHSTDFLTINQRLLCMKDRKEYRVGWGVGGSRRVVTKL